MLVISNGYSTVWMKEVYKLKLYTLQKWSLLIIA